MYVIKLILKRKIVKRKILKITPNQILKRKIAKRKIVNQKLPSESQSKVIELVRLDTILNDSISFVWREIHERDRKGLKMIDINKIKNADSFIFQLRAIINHKILLLKTSVIAKLNIIIGDIKNKSNIGDVYNYNDKDKLFMIDNDLGNYMKHLKRDIGDIKQNLKTISVYQTDSHKTLMRFLK